MKAVIAIVIVLLLAACGPSAQEQRAAAQAAAAAKAEREAAEQTVLYQRNLDAGEIELAAAYAELIMARYPRSQAAQRIAPGFAAIREQAQAAKETRRLEALWTYQTSAVGGGTQRTATIYSEDGASPHVQLVLRQHTKWGLSVFLLPGSDIFRCTRCTATLKTDQGAGRVIAVTKSTSRENPALFIDDEKALLRLLETAQQVTIEVPVNDGQRCLKFSVAGYQPKRFVTP